MIRIGAITIFLLLCCAPAAEGVEDRHGVISLDYCADQYVLHLVPREDIIAVSKDATASYSFSRDLARGLPQHKGRADEVLALGPSIVVRSYGGTDIIPHLNRVGITVIDIGYPSSLAETHGVLRDVGAQLGAAPQAIENLLEAHPIDVLPPTGKSALYLTPGGVTAGSGTIIDELIQSAGYTNYETRSFYPSLPVEQLAGASPDLIVTSFFNSEYAQAPPWSSIRHPVTKNAVSGTAHVDVPAKLTSCTAWYTANGIKIIAEGARAE